MKFYLLTFHGMFLSVFDGGAGVTQVAFQSTIDRGSLLAVDLEEGWARQSFENFIGRREASRVDTFIRHLGPCSVRNNVERRTLTVTVDGLFLSALPHGAVECNRQEAHEWENVLAVSDDDLDLLEVIMKSQWIVRSSRALVPGSSITLGKDYSLLVDDLELPLAYNLPFDRTNYPFRLTILKDGWRIDELVLYKPLIYYLAFGESSNVFEQLSLSLQSLATIGKFSGDVMIFTDRPAEDIAREAKWFSPDRILTKYIPATDWIGFVAGKYCIIEEPRAYAYQPVVYMDPDIIYNTNANSFIIEMAISDRLTAPLELFSPLEHAPSVGASLLQLDNAQPRFACGFNGGTIGIPNLEKHRHTLALIRRIILNFLSIRGRNAFPWVDQEAANYVSFKIAHFDTNEISKAVRYGRDNVTTHPEPRSGLVHFWGVSRKNRPQVMQEYLDKLLALDAETTSKSQAFTSHESDS